MPSGSSWTSPRCSASRPCRISRTRYGGRSAERRNTISSAGTSPSLSTCPRAGKGAQRRVRPCNHLRQGRKSEQGPLRRHTRSHRERGAGVRHQAARTRTEGSKRCSCCRSRSACARSSCARSPGITWTWTGEWSTCGARRAAAVTPRRRRHGRDSTAQDVAGEASCCCSWRTAAPCPGHTGLPHKAAIRRGR